MIDGRAHLAGLPSSDEGSGNDFFMFAVASRHQTIGPGPYPCGVRKGDGLGADGLVFVAPSSPDAIRMIYFNSDGSRAALCGNAALCTTRLAAHLGLGNGHAVRLETDAGTYESRSASEDGRAELHLAPVAAPLDVPRLRREEGEQRAALSVVGVPHLVVLVADVDQVDVVQRGRVLRHDPALGADGANVNFGISERRQGCEAHL